MLHAESTVTTGGLSNLLISTVETGGSLIFTIHAIILPVLALILIILLLYFIIKKWRSFYLSAK